MRQDLSYHHWVLDAGDDPHSAAAGLTGLNIYPEYALKTLQDQGVRVLENPSQRASVH